MSILLWLALPKLLIMFLHAEYDQGPTIAKHKQICKYDVIIQSSLSKALTRLDRFMKSDVRFSFS